MAYSVNTIYDKSGIVSRGLKCMIRIYERTAKEYFTEKVVGENFMKFSYNKRCGRIGTEVLLKRKFYSLINGVFCDSKLSRCAIKKFVQEYDIDISECVDKIEDYKTFNEFFIRKMHKHSRNFNKGESCFLSPCDGRIRAWENIDINKLVQVKDIDYTLEELIGDRELASIYNGGTCIIFRLAPVDYHRFHFVDSGICGESVKIKGVYYSVNPIALKNVANVFIKNKRERSILQSQNFGRVLYVEVGATSVGKIIQTYKSGKVIKGEEKGYFKFGGSTIILFLEKNMVRIDEDILEQTKKGYESMVKAGEKIGEKV